MRNRLVVSSHHPHAPYARRRARTVRHSQTTYRHRPCSTDVTEITRQITNQRHRAYYWSWGEWIAPVSDPATAARMISVMLQAVPQPAHD